MSSPTGGAAAPRENCVGVRGGVTCRTMTMGQIWVATSTGETGSGEVPVDERMLLGSAIRHARVRRGLSIAAVARLVLLSPSTLQRMEIGERKVDREDLIRLDAALETNGELSALHASLQCAHEPPSHSVQRSSTEASHRWPAEWAGIVWVLVENTGTPGATTRVHFRWGPWRVDATIKEPTIFETFKAPDDASVPIRVNTSHTTDIWFGTGQRPQGSYPLQDIRNRWVRSEGNSAHE